MSTLTIRHKGKFGLPMPYIIAINNKNIGVMRNREIKIHGLIDGFYNITIKAGAIFNKRELIVSGTTDLCITGEQNITIDFCDNEILWNILFDIDLLLWLVEFFITLPSPWNLIYKIASDGFFAIWIIRLFIIRKRYFRLTIS